MSSPNLYEVRLPAGDVPGFDVGRKNDNGSRLYNPEDWFSKGYVGVRFIGKGQGITHIRPALNVWTNVFIGQHNGIVWLEDLTLHNGPRSAIQAGTGLWSGLPFFPKFRLVTRGVMLDCSQPGMWGMFTYECDRDDADLTIFGELLSEHTSYAHQWAKYGAIWNRVTVYSSGGDDFKARPDASEVRPVSGARIILRDCTLKGWNGPRSTRGGAGTTLQGIPGCDVLIERCVYWGGAGSHCRCIMIDDGEGKASTLGAPGHVVIRQVAAQGSSERTDYGDTLVRVGPLSGAMVAKSLTLDRCSLWGKNMAVQFGGIPAGKLVVKDSNTPALRDWANAKAFDTTFEAQLPRPQRRVPISEGLIA